MAYTLAKSRATPGSNLAGLTASASSRVALTGFFDFFDHGTVAQAGMRAVLQRVTGGVTPTTQTPEKLSPLAPAALTTGTLSWSTAPTTVGNPLLAFGRSEGTVGADDPRTWRPVNPNLPILVEVSGIIAVFHNPGDGGTPAWWHSFDEADRVHPPRQSRRGRRRGFAFFPDHANILPAVATQPFRTSNIAPAAYLQEADWPGTTTGVASLALQGAGGPAGVDPVPADEVDTAVAVTFTKTIFVTATPAAETDAAVAAVAAKTLAVTPAAETDAAQAVSAVKAATATSAPETDAAVAAVVTKTIFKTLTPAAETDTAVAASAVKTPAVTPAAETDAAQTAAAAKARSATPATETDAAQALAAAKNVSVTPAAETDSAQVVTVTKTIFVTVTPAAETDTGQALSYFLAGGSYNVAPASESDAATPASVAKTVAVTPAAETDAAQTVVVTKPIIKTPTPAAETDTAVTAAAAKNVTATPAAETDAAQAVAFTKPIRVTLTSAVEADTAVALTRVSPISVTVTPATETDTAIGPVVLAAGSTTFTRQTRAPGGGFTYAGRSDGPDLTRLTSTGPAITRDATAHGGGFARVDDETDTGFVKV